MGAGSEMADARSARAAPAIVVTLPANLMRLFPGAVRRLMEFLEPLLP